MAEPGDLEARVRALENLLGRLLRTSGGIETGGANFTSDVTVDGALSVDPSLTITGTEDNASLILNVNSSDASDNSEVDFLDTGVLRNRLRYDQSEENFFIDRYDASGVFQDSPVTINNTNGNSLFLGAIVKKTDGPADLTLNAGGTTGNMDPRIRFLDDDVARWVLRMDESTDKFHLRRHNSSGVYQDTPLEIDGADGSVTLEGGWQTWTPTFLNLTVGNGTVTGKYRYMNGSLEMEGRLTWGSTTSITSNDVYVYTPNSETLDTAIASATAGLSYYQDVGTIAHVGQMHVSSGAFRFIRLQVSGANINTNVITATTPFTWTTGDIMQWSCTGRMT